MIGTSVMKELKYPKEEMHLYVMVKCLTFFGKSHLLELSYKGILELLRVCLAKNQRKNGKPFYSGHLLCLQRTVLLISMVSATQKLDCHNKILDSFSENNDEVERFDVLIHVKELIRLLPNSRCKKLSHLLFLQEDFSIDIGLVLHMSLL